MILWGCLSKFTPKIRNTEESWGENKTNVPTWQFLEQKIHISGQTRRHNSFCVS